MGSNIKTFNNQSYYKYWTGNLSRLYPVVAQCQLGLAPGAPETLKGGSGFRYWVDGWILKMISRASYHLYELLYI